MKRNLIVLSIVVLVVIFNAANVFGQSEKSSIIKLNPLSLGVATLNVQFEHAVSENNSWQLGVFYTGISVSDTKFSGFGITPEYRFYLSSSKPAPKGFFAAPYLRYQNFSLSTTNSANSVKSKATLSSFGGGVIFGYQTLIADKISFEVFLGPSYSSSSISVKDNANSDNFSTGTFGSGIGVRTGITFGIAF